MTTSPLNDITTHLTSRSAGSAGRRALERFAGAGIDCSNAASPIELALRCQSASDPARSAATVAGLVALAGADELAALTALVALQPGLRRIALRLVRGGAVRMDAEADVAAIAWERIVELADRTHGPHVARAVLEGTWSRARRLAGSRRSGQARTAPAVLCRDAHDHCAADERADPAVLVTLLLEDAERAGALGRRQVVLLEEHVVQDRPLALLAAGSGRSLVSLQKDRQRAERALRSYVSAYASEDGR
ncbi:MAG: hypothetical protein JWO62_1005 [Acidimicrobiaceae bacterium]|nr:hypothetical protein [Acidimicrobiaceae bacterium]